MTEKVNDIQHGGDHYKKYGDLQPWDVVIKWKLGYLEGTALKYIARWRDKNGIEDIKKAIHFLQKLVEVEEADKERIRIQNCYVKQPSPSTSLFTEIFGSNNATK